MSNTYFQSGTFKRITKRTFVSRTVGLGTAALIGSVGSATAQDTSAGDAIWRFDTDSFVVSSPTIVDQTVYVGSNDGSVYALDAETGEKQWEYTGSGESVRSSPNVVGGTVYIGDDSGALYALDSDTGEKKWKKDVGINNTNSPVVADGTVYVSGMEQGVYALNADTGEENWHFGLSFAGQGSPVVVDGTVYVGEQVGDNSPAKVYAIDSETGDERWVSEFPEDGWTVITSPTYDNGSLYVGEELREGRNRENSHLRAIDARTGETEWVFDTHGSARELPTVANESVYVGTAFQDDSENWQGTLHSIDAASGEDQWSFENESTNIGSAPTIAADNIYVGSDGIYCLDAQTGTVNWEFGCYTFRSSPTVVDGVVFAGNDDGIVYAIDTGAEESSNDSRIRHGVLGHHHSWVGDESQQLDPVVSTSPNSQSCVSDDSNGGFGSLIIAVIIGIIGSIAAFIGYRRQNENEE
jgi:outer membrane protein assembly factor BamB